MKFLSQNFQFWEWINHVNPKFEKVGTGNEGMTIFKFGKKQKKIWIF